MSKYKHRGFHEKIFMGEKVKFVESNERVVERVNNLSHEREMIERMITVSKPDDTIWDIGACLGIHSFITALHLPYGKVVSFEPMPTNRAVLVDNMNLNRINNIDVEKYAVADEKGQEMFSIRESMDAGFGRHGITVDKYDDIGRIGVDKIDGETYCREGNKVPNIVKIDVEGASPLVLQGMEDILKDEKCREVFLETHEPNPIQPSHEDFGFTRGDIIKFLESCGFEVGIVEEKFHLHATKDSLLKERIEDDKYKLKSLNLIIEKGDISKRDEDIIVNSAGTSLRMGSGVAGALRKEGGEDINKDAIIKGPIELGDAIVTNSYDLECEKIVHAASMPHYGKGKSTPESISKATRSALEKSEELNYSSLVLPAIGCGIGGVPITQGVPEIIEQIKKFDANSIDKIVLIGYTKEEYNSIRRIAENKIKET